LRTITRPGTPKLAHEHGIDMDSSKRYHLYVSHACPYSARAVLARCIKQLTDEITMSAVEPVRGPEGWVFGSGEYTDPMNSFRTLREVYEATDASYDGRVSVPVLWDRATRRIVSTESGDIMRMLGSTWDGGGTKVTVYLFSPINGLLSPLTQEPTYIPSSSVLALSPQRTMVARFM
jgi:putative glutathione S-transferase